MEEFFPSLELISLGVFDFVIPEAFWDWCEISLENTEADFLPGFKHFLGRLLLCFQLRVLSGFGDSMSDVEILLQA